MMNFERKDPFVIARVLGASLDVGTAAEFKRLLIEAVGDRQVVLLVDLSAVHEIDSSGLGAIVAVLKSVRRFGGRVRLCGATSTIREMLELMMLHRVLPLHPSTEDALMAEAVVGCID
jgi:anti-anti-sigma factor